MKLHFLIGLFALFSLVSCISYEDINVDNINNVEVKSSGAQNMLIDVSVDIENDSRSFSLKEANIEAVKGNKVYASVSLLNKVKVNSGTNDNLIIPLRINLNGGLLGAAAFMMNIKSMRYNVSVKVSSFIISKKVEYKNLTSDEVEKIIGMDINQLIRR